METTNPYLTEIQSNLPRILSLIDRDPTNASYGMGDRYHWAWGLIDFGNGTFKDQLTVAQLGLQALAI